MVISGLACFLVPIFTDYYALSSLAGTYGLAVSANYSLTSVILVDLISLEKFSSAYGFLLLVQGIANLLGPPLSGM